MKVPAALAMTADKKAAKRDKKAEKAPSQHQPADAKPREKAAAEQPPSPRLAASLKGLGDEEDQEMEEKREARWIRQEKQGPLDTPVAVAARKRMMRRRWR